MQGKILNFALRNESKKINRTYDIDLDNYKKMRYLSKSVYQATLSDIVAVSVNYLCENENLTIRKTETAADTVRCTFSLPENTVSALEGLNAKYRDFSMNSLVNMAIGNALLQEESNLINFSAEGEANL